MHFQSQATRYAGGLRKAPKRLSIPHISNRLNGHGDQKPIVEFEAVEPAHRRFSPAGDLLEYLVAVDTPVATNHQRGRIDEGESSVLTATGMQVMHSGIRAEGLNDHRLKAGGFCAGRRGLKVHL